MGKDIRVLIAHISLGGIEILPNKLYMLKSAIGKIEMSEKESHTQDGLEVYFS